MTIFREDDDCRTFLRLLQLVVESFSVRLHAFVLMLNHYHLLLTATDVDQLSNSMGMLAWRYARYFNAKYQRTGTLWERRYYSKAVDTEEYLLRCLRYIEQNPVRANVTMSPAEYQWSSYRHHACLQTIDFVTSHPVYVALGASASERAAAYRAICGAALDEDELLSVRLVK